MCTSALLGGTELTQSCHYLLAAGCIISSIDCSYNYPLARNLVTEICLIFPCACSAIVSTVLKTHSCKLCRVDWAMMVGSHQWPNKKIYILRNSASTECCRRGVSRTKMVRDRDRYISITSLIHFLHPHSLGG